MVARFALRCARAASGHAAAPPSSVMKLRRPIIRSPRRLANADIRSGSYLPSFQISAASFQSPPIFSHTTRYLPVTSFGIGPLVLKVPISRAAEGPSGLTSRVVSFGSLTCSAMLFQSASIAALPLHHSGTRWKCGRIIGVERRDASEITLVEEIDPFRVHHLNFSLLGERRQNQPDHQGNR